MVEHSPAIGIVLKNFINFIDDDIILGHNIAAYDSTILYDLCEQYGLREFNNKMLDTLWYSHYCDIEVSDYKLTAIAKYFGIEYQAHRALNDCTANFYVYEKLKERFRGFYIFTGRRQTSMAITGIKPEYTELSRSDIKGGIIRKEGRKEIYFCCQSFRFRGIPCSGLHD